MPDLFLLCHPTELTKPSNTGQLLPGLLPASALDAAGEPAAAAVWRCYQIGWQRKAPNPHFIAALQRGGAVLLYPSAQARYVDFDSALPLQLADNEPLRSVIVLDATWQLAQKMYNQSPYLHELPHWRASSNYQSTFMLRRNQRDGAWCTAETVALLWQASGAEQQANQLWQLFHRFNQR